MNIFKHLASLSFLFAYGISAYGQSHPQIRMDDRVRIKEAMTISKQYGEKIWPGINKVPFTIILVTDSVEFLIEHPSPSEDFAFLGYDSVLGSKVYYRNTVFNKRFLATFPAVGGVNTIVVGTPENTGKHSTEWIITLLHEHFHQYTYSSPNYYADVGKLDLSGGDQTGMWMLNYPFPYTDSTVTFQYKKYAAELSTTLASIGTNSFESDFKKYITKRKLFQQSLKPTDYRYFSFQIWQEGVARYTEYKFLELLETYQPSKEMMSLPDYMSFEKYREEFYREQFNRITDCSLEKSERVCFYAVGLAEGLILDKLNPSWRENYLSKKFYLEEYAKEFDSKEQ